MEKPAQIQEVMTQDLIKYQKMLNWTGGALTLHKCFFGIMEWDFTEEGLPKLKNKDYMMEIPTSEQDQTEIEAIKQQIRENQNKVNPVQQHQIAMLTGEMIETGDQIQNFVKRNTPTIKIKQKNGEIQKSLGLYMQANGDTTGVEEAFRQQNQKYGHRIVTSKLQPQEIRLAHKAIHILGQCYHFQGAPFMEKFLQKETNKMTTKILPKLKLNRNHPIALRHALTNRGGLQLPNFHVI